MRTLTITLLALFAVTLMGCAGTNMRTKHARVKKAQDGTGTAYLDTREGNGLSWLYYRDAFGQTVKVKTDSDSIWEENFAISPDGKKVAYSVGEYGTPEDVYIWDAETGATNRITDDNLNNEKLRFIGNTTLVFYADGVKQIVRLK